MKNKKHSMAGLSYVSAKVNITDTDTHILRSLYIDHKYDRIYTKSVNRIFEFRQHNFHML
jgi:hypothetical protein